jgi:hypothetical protein
MRISKQSESFGESAFTADGMFTRLILHPVVQLCASIFWTRSVDGQGTRYDTGRGASAGFGTFSESEHTTVEGLWAYSHNRLANKRASRVVIHKLGASRSG